MGLVWIGFVAFFLVALTVGIRVLLLASRTRALPELTMGIGVLGIGPVGFGLMVAANHIDNVSVQTAMLAIASLAVSAGVFAKFVFNWRVYHPESSAVRAIVVAAGIALVACYALAGLTYGFSAEHALEPASLARSGLQISCLLWGAGESIGYWTKMRRRVRLGLADPVVANRFLLWGIGAFAAGFGTAVGTTAQIVTGVTTTQEGWVLVSSSMHGLVAAVAIALAFIPPRAYLRYIEARSQGAGSAS